MLKRVYICSPLSGDIPQNIEKAKLYMTYALKCGTAPIVPHFYALGLDDSDPKQREIGMRAGMSHLWFCDELWVFGDKITSGMREEIRFCKSLNIPIKQITEEQILKAIPHNAVRTPCLLNYSSYSPRIT